MNLRFFLSSLVVLIIFQSCATSKDTTSPNTVFWVGGFKTEASAGAGKRQVLRIHRGDNINNPEWEYFYSNIEGFEFEEGYMQQIEVKETQLDISQVPADASSIKYTLVKILDKQKDIRAELNGSWSLTKLNSNLLNRMVTVPTMAIDLSKMIISGSSGCNNFTGQIQQLASTQVTLSPIAMTKKMCANKNVEDEFIEAMNTINTFHIKGSNLSFYNQDGKEVLSFLKAD